MFKPPGASVPSLKMSRLSSRCRVGAPPFTCLTRHSHVMDLVVVREIEVFGHAHAHARTLTVLLVNSIVCFFILPLLFKQAIIAPNKVISSQHDMYKHLRRIIIEFYSPTY